MSHIGRIDGVPDQAPDDLLCFNDQAVMVVVSITNIHQPDEATLQHETKTDKPLTAITLLMGNLLTVLPVHRRLSKLQHQIML
jgi:hypothetical protein